MYRDDGRGHIGITVGIHSLIFYSSQRVIGKGKGLLR